MKTAGTNFLVQFDRLFPADAIWPQYRPGKETAAEHWDTISDYLSLGSLLALSDEQRRQLAFVAGHLPFATVELLPDNGDLACLTLVRDPVERTVSFLAQCRKHRPELSDLPLESIYDDPWYFDRFVRDHQTRVLSMTLEEAMAPGTCVVRFVIWRITCVPWTSTAVAIRSPGLIFTPIGIDGAGRTSYQAAYTALPLAVQFDSVPICSRACESAANPPSPTQNAE